MISSITLRRHGGAELTGLNTSSFSFLAIDFSSQSSPPHLLYHHLLSSDYDWQALSSAAIILACYFLFLWLRTLYFRTHPLVTSAKVVIDGTMSPNVDLAIVFKAGSSSLLKSAIRDEAAQAEQQYTKLIDTLKSGGLYAVGRRGETRDQLLVLVYCPQEKIASLVQHERYSDFLYGLSTSNLASVGDTSAADKLAPADRLRIIHGYVTSTTQDCGLGINPDAPEWSRVQSVMCLHDHDFNNEWIRSWTTHSVGMKELDRIRDQFGESVALYFSFLSGYTKFLAFPSALGIAFYFFGTPYSLVYSSLLVLWAVTFAEWWRVRERVLSVRWQTRGSFRVERRRAQFVDNTSVGQREARAAASVPLILLAAGFLATLITGLFVFEAFLTQLYTGPGHEYIGFAPTVLFMALVPRFLALYQAMAVRTTAWENHQHQSTHEASLTIKTFSLSAIVAYLNLALSAFVYVPFGPDVMAAVHRMLFKHSDHALTQGIHAAAEGYAQAANATQAAGKIADRGLWQPDALQARGKLNPSRLQDQMYAYTVTNQLINVFLEVGMPFVTRAISSRGKGASSNGKKKRVIFSDEADASDDGGERELLERVRAEAALPDYALFADYSEMVTQFGYVALWSTIWPLAPAMSLLNNVLELRSDAYKITVHNRRPVPSRTDTIGPWLDGLALLSWLSALTNAALVYLFRPGASARTTTLREEHVVTSEIAGRAPATAREMLIGAAMAALVASHGLLALRFVVRRVVEQLVWRGNAEVLRADEADRRVKEGYVRSLGIFPDGLAEGQSIASSTKGVPAPKEKFWQLDEGLNEIRRAVKEE